MRVMDELTESHRRTPSFHHAGAQSPRVGGCVGAFFNMFDWNPSKRFSSTKRITAERPNSDALRAGRGRSFTERSSTAILKLPLINEEKDEAFSASKNTPSLSSTPSLASVRSDDTSKRVPGVVARLMGLESLPDGTHLFSKSESQYLQSTLASEQLDSSPVLLKELLRQEIQHSKKSLKEKLPGFTRKHQETISTRGPVSQRKKSTGHFGEHAHPYGDSRASRPGRASEKKTSSTQEVNKVVEKQPFLARLNNVTPSLLPSKSQNSNSSLQPQLVLGSKNTVNLLEAAVKSLEPRSMLPSPKSRSRLTRESQSENGASFRSEKGVIASSHSAQGSISSSSSRSLRSQPITRTDKAEHGSYVVAEMGSPGSRSFRSRHECCKQDQASRRRFEMALVASAKSPSPSRSRASNSKKVEHGSPRAVLGTTEASIRSFKVDLGYQDEPLEKVEKQGSDSESLVLEALPENLFVTPPRSEGVKVVIPEPCNREQYGDVKAKASQGLPSMSNATSEKSVSSDGIRSIRFRNRSGKKEKDIGSQGNRVFPSEKHSAEKSCSPSPTPVGAGFSYSMLFSGRKQVDKKEGTDKGEALPMKRTDSTLMRSLLKRPTRTPGPSPVTATKSGPQCNAKKTTKPSKNVIVGVDEKKVATAKFLATQDSPAVDGSLQEALSSNKKQLDVSKDGPFVQTRNKYIDDVFPELPLEENDVGRESPDLAKTIKAVEKQFLGLASQGDMAPFDCRSIEQMFGKGFSKAYASSTCRSPDFSSLKNPAPETSPVSPDIFVTECGSVPGTFPNSPMVKYEKIFFSSKNHVNLQDMFEVVSGDGSHDLAGRRHSFRLSEPRERVLNSSDDEEAAADLDTCSTSAVCDTGGTPERLEIQKMPVDAGWSEDVMVTPPALKKFEEKLAQGCLYSDASCVEECGQPSPVSVLENPFLDEVQLTPETSRAGSQQTDGDVKDIYRQLSLREEEEKILHQLKEITPASKSAEVASLDMIETEKITQAIRDISRFRNIDVTSIGLEPPTLAPVEPQQEENYVREVLDAANLLRDGESAWHSVTSPMNHSLFDRLEFGSINLDKRTLMGSKRWGSLPAAPRQGSSIRSERKLLFECVNEVMTLEPWMKTSSFYVDLPMFPDLHSTSKFRSPISGEPLVKEVYRMINHWRDIAGNVLDDLIDYDMNVPEGRWVDFSHEVADIGLDIECMLMTDLIEEVASMLSARALMASS